MPVHLLRSLFLSFHLQMSLLDVSFALLRMDVNGVKTDGHERHHYYSGNILLIIIKLQVPYKHITIYHSLGHSRLSV
jgi:hypothetical protein